MDAQRAKATRIGLIVALVSAGAMLTGCVPFANNDYRQPEQTDEAISDADLDLLAKITVGGPPEDLIWYPPRPLPEGWKAETFDEEGVSHVTVTPNCMIQFRQPAGLGDSDDPDSAQVALDFSEELGQKAFDTELTVTSEEPVMFGAIINDGAMDAKLSFARVGFTAPELPELAGTTYALRSGDYALIVTAACGAGEFAAKGEEMLRFVESARADVTY